MSSYVNIAILSQLYRKYLAGFKSRKKLRKKAAQRQKSEREKRFQKEVKQEVIEKLTPISAL